MAKKPLTIEQGVQLDKQAAARDYNFRDEGLIYNNNDEEIRVQIGYDDRALLTDTQTQLVQNKILDDTNTVTLKDDNLVIEDNLDITKRIQLDVSGVTAGQTRTLSSPDASGEILLKNNTVSVTNKTIDADTNTIQNLEVDNLKSGVLDTDLTSVSASDDTIPSAKATKSYVDSISGAVNTALSNHITDTTDAHLGTAIGNTPLGNLSATTVQAALNELQSDIDTRALNSDLSNHISATTDAHDASAISNIPSGNLAANNVQSALNELQGDCNTNASAISGHINDTSGAHDSTAISHTTYLHGDPEQPGLTTVADQIAILDLIGQPHGLPYLAEDGKIPSTFLPSYVDDVLEYDNLAAFPATGESSKIYVALDTNKTYRWSGSAYIEISPSAVNSVNGQTGAVVLNKSDVGLGNVDNTSDATKNSAVAVLTNKDIDGGTASNTSRITLPKDTLANLTSLTRKEGTVAYGSDTDKVYYDDGVSLTPIGSGGAGSPAIYSTLKSDEDSGTWTTGNNATFLGAGAISGTFVKQNGTNPLNGAYSYTLTQATGSLNDYVVSPNQPVPLRARGNTNRCKLVYTYDGLDNDIKAIIYDATNSAILSSQTAYVKTSSIGKQFEILFDVPATCVNLRVGFHVVVANSGKVLKFDDIQVSDEAFSVANLVNDTEWTNVTPVLGGFSVQPIINLARWKKQGSDLLYELRTTGGTTSASTLTVPFPSGLTASNAIGNISGMASSEGSGYQDLGVSNDLTQFRFYRASSGLGDVATTGSNINGGSLRFSFFARVPIAGWTAVSENIIQSWQPSDCIGEIKYLPQNVAPQGFLPANGSIIGLSSGSHQGNTYYDLYNVLWNVAQTTAGEPYVISSAKGASASADWSAGKTIKIDESGLFTRAYKSGVTNGVGQKQDDAFQGHRHSPLSPNTGFWGVNPGGNAFGGTGIGNGFNASTTGSPITDGTNGTPRTASETRPTNVAKYAFIRYATAQPLIYALPSYFGGNQYNLTVTGSGWTTTRATASVIQKSDSSYHLIGNVVGAVTSSSRTGFTITITGVTFKNVAGFYQPISCSSDASVAVSGDCAPNAATMTCIHASATTTRYGFSFDVELESKPSFV